MAIKRFKTIIRDRSLTPNPTDITGRGVVQIHLDANNVIEIDLSHREDEKPCIHLRSIGACPQLVIMPTASNVLFVGVGDLGVG